MSTLPKELGWTSDHMYQYQGFWYTSMNLEGVMWAQQHFKATHLDVFLASTPKSGTTWLKALMFAIMNRTRFDFSTHPLLTSNPHELVTLLEFYFHWNIPYPNPNTPLPKTQLFQTHIPFTSLPESIVDSQYINLAPLSIEEAIEQFCKGVSLFGPFWDHVLGYWKVTRDFIIEKKKFFQKGEVGDWKNHLTTEMGDCLNRIMDQKLDGSGLTFHDSLET
ncbi:unnamed protein product, partial [Vitis vinifera]